MSRVPAIRFKGFTDPWEQRKLGELVGTTYGGGTPSTSKEEYWDGDIPWIQSSNVLDGELFYVDIPKSITAQGLRESAALLVPKESIAVVTHVGVGKLVYLPFSYATSQDFVSLSDLKCDTQYLCYAIFKRLQSELHMVQGSAIKGITKEELLSKTISLPNLVEQRLLGKALLSLDTLITLHQCKYDKLCTVKKSMLDKMFPKPGETFPEIRFEGFTDPWEQRKFSELIERRNDYSDDPILPRVEYEDIVPSQGTLNKDVINKRDKRSGIVFESGDVLYGKLRPYLQNWLNPQFRGIALGDFWVLNPIRIDSGFLFYLIRTPTFERIANESVGTKMPRADWQNVSNAEFVISSSENEQHQIGTFFQKLDQLITLHQRKLELLKNVKKSLLDKMFV